jgi:hypothetical protein
VGAPLPNETGNNCGRSALLGYQSCNRKKPGPCERAAKKKTEGLIHREEAFGSRSENPKGQVGLVANIHRADEGNETFRLGPGVGEDRAGHVAAASLHGVSVDRRLECIDFGQELVAVTLKQRRDPGAELETVGGSGIVAPLLDVASHSRLRTATCERTASECRTGETDESDSSSSDTSKNRFNHAC